MRIGIPKTAYHFFILFFTTLLFVTSYCFAGTLTKEEMVQRFPSPYIVGDKDSELPVWPVFKQNATENQLVGYVFESIDMAPIPGFAGEPINLLIAMDPKGKFFDVKVLNQHEPVFVDGLGPAPLFQFVDQYVNLSLNQNIKIGKKQGIANTDAHAVIDGVTKATASVRIINQTILASAIKVARKKLGFAQTRDPDRIATIKSDLLEKHSVDDLFNSGLVQHVVIKNKDVEQQFAGTDGAGLDSQATQHPNEAFIDIYVAYVSIPSIGSNLLQAESWRRLSNRLEKGDHAILFMTKGRYSLTGDEFVRGSVPSRVLLVQEKLPLEMRDLDMDLKIAPSKNGYISANSDPNDPNATSIVAFRIIRQAGLDPAQPIQISLPITRAKGIVYPEKFTQNVSFTLDVPERFYNAAEGDNKSWRGIWRDRAVEIAVLLAGLLVLSIGLAKQKWLAIRPRFLEWYRRVFLLYTLFFIGWYAQGQLSIVNLTGFIQALLAHHDLLFLLYDPMTIILWAYVLVTLFIWGRGTFCGWLCPFGALQELVGTLAKIARIPQWHIHSKLDAKLKWIKYGLFAVIILSLLIGHFMDMNLTDKVVEIEPFKTAITLNFVRSLPFVIYAAGLLVLAAINYKFFCRYMCPFGANLALMGLLRRLNWIPRRTECGTPCQTCKHRCEYQAIKVDGKVDYQECFQCLDCVVIYESDEKCAPLILEKKRQTVIPIYAN